MKFPWGTVTILVCILSHNGTIHWCYFIGFLGEQLLLYSTKFPSGTMRIEIYYTTKNPQFPWGTVTIHIDWQESIVPPGNCHNITNSSPGEQSYKALTGKKIKFPWGIVTILVSILRHDGTIHPKYFIGFLGEQSFLYSVAFPFGTIRVEIYYNMKNSQFPWGTVTMDIDWQESIIPPGNCHNVTIHLKPWCH